MLRLLKYANAIYNLHRYDIGCDISRAEFYKIKFECDHNRMMHLCSILYKKLY